MKRKRSVIQKRSAGDNGLVVEIFVVLDPEAVKAYMDFFDDEQKVINLALIIVNDIQGPNSIGKPSSLLLDRCQVACNDVTSCDIVGRTNQS